MAGPPQLNRYTCPRRRSEVANWNYNSLPLVPPLLTALLPAVPASTALLLPRHLEVPEPLSADVPLPTRRKRLPMPDLLLRALRVPVALAAPC